MKDEAKRERDQPNGRDVKSSRDRRGRSPSRRDRSRSPVERRGKDSTKAARRVYFANVSFDTRWTEIKDFFRDKIGNVTYCQLFEDESGRSRGCGLIEFSDLSSAQRAIDELHKHDFKGRDLVVKEDIDCDRDRYGRLITSKKDKDSRDGSHSHREPDRISRQQSIYDPSRQTYSNSYNTYGLSPQFLESLNITGPLNNRIFVANLDYKVGEKKLEEIFRLAGKVLRVRLYTDQGGTSKGHGTVEFEHPVEAVQAISMFHDQNLYGRAMSIRMDKYEPEEMPEVLPSKLPSGLESIGKGLGIGGQPLNIGKSLSNASLGTQQSATAVLAQSQPTLTAQQTVAAPVAAQPQMNSYSLSSLTSALGQQNVGLNPTLSSLSSLSTPQVNQATLSSFGLHNLNASNLSNLSSLGNQNLTQLANTAQNVLQNVALSSNSLGNPSLGNPSLGNPSLGQLTSAAGQATSSLFSSYDRDSYQSDKFRNGGVSSIASSQSLQSAGSDKILVRNLPASFSLQNIKDRFREFGEVRHVSPLNRNMALVVYTNYNDAASAVAMMNGLRINDKVLELGITFLR